MCIDRASILILPCQILIGELCELVTCALQYLDPSGVVMLAYIWISGSNLMSTLLWRYLLRRVTTGLQ